MLSFELRIGIWSYVWNKLKLEILGWFWLIELGFARAVVWWLKWSSLSPSFGFVVWTSESLLYSLERRFRRSSGLFCRDKLLRVWFLCSSLGLIAWAMCGVWCSSAGFTAQAVCLNKATRTITFYSLFDISLSTKYLFLFCSHLSLKTLHKFSDLPWSVDFSIFVLWD